MKAVILPEHGGPEKLIFERDVPDPEMGASDCLVRVRACALNHLDIWVRNGLPGVTIPLPHILGCDVAGVIDAVGPKVNRFKAGDHVLLSPGQSCGACSWCRSGWDSLCPGFNILGFRIPGGYAELVRAREQDVIALPSQKLSSVEWAAVPLVFLTAWHMLMTLARLERGESVLIHAAGSGIGSAAVQVAKWRGARVITTVGNEKKIEPAKRLGADEVLLSTRENVQERVLELTGREGVDVVFEHIGPETFQTSLACLRKKGRLVTCGATSGPRVDIDLRPLYVKQQSIHGSYMGGRRELDEVLGLVAAGKLKPVVDTVFPLREARAAHERMESRAFFGKMVLTHNF